ncbi:ComF family protein [Flavisphingomonas formosensis]|uniref:ComF family protein n=1 Tax=Flavisphingomonas formosensis TaxID=861534 RepID=UPI0012FB9FC0|nr:ComF family protein [Sphingomonas formosensis]
MGAWAAYLKSGIGQVIAFALPPRCPGCGAVTGEDHSFCADCWQQLDFLGDPACAACGDPFALDRGPDALCGACLADRPAFDRARGAVAYGEIARKVALRLKYGGRPALAETIARAIARLADEEQDALIVPIPLHRWRIWRRGYNQAALIATALGRRTGIPVELDLVRRVKATPVLRAMGPAARAKALRGAFRVTGRHRAMVKGRAILLVDDVYTTGATGNACARALKKAGAARVRLVCWARVVRDEAERH